MESRGLRSFKCRITTAAEASRAGPYKRIDRIETINDKHRDCSGRYDTAEIQHQFRRFASAEQQKRKRTESKRYNSHYHHGSEQIPETHAAVSS